MERLFTPGPVEVPEAIRAAMAAPLVHHRTGEFSEMLGGLAARLGPILGTTRPVHLVAASGTGGMEAALVNTVYQGDVVLTVHAGKFGERWGELCGALGLASVPLEVEWGRALTQERLAATLDAHSEVTVACFTHSETSTGVLMDLEALAAVCAAHQVRVVCDCVTSATAHAVEMDAWGLDCVVSGSQKGFMLPPGLAMVAFSERVEAAKAEPAAPSYYFDLRQASGLLERGQTPFTPAIGLCVGLRAALDALESEGLAAVIDRHAHSARAVRAGVKALGFELVPNPPSNVVTVFEVPGTLDERAVREALSRRFQVRIAGGQGKLAGKILRIGHLGHYTPLDLFGVLVALERVLIDQGWPAAPGSAAAAASQCYQDE